MPARYRLNTAAAIRAIETEMKRRLHVVAILVLNHWREMINTEGTAVGKGGRLIYGANPSKPGDPPHKQTGRALGSTAYEVVGMIARVGTNLLYFRWLELGTVKMAARPSLRRALLEKWHEVQAILGRPIR